MKVNVKNDKFQRNGKFPVSPSINKQKNIVIFKFYPLDLKHRIERRFNKLSVKDFVSNDAPSSDCFEVDDVYLWY